jgi:hypothetical protein
LEKELEDRGLSKIEARRLAGIARGRPGVAFEFVKDPEAYKDFVESAQERMQVLAKPLFERFIWTENKTKKLKAEKLAEEYRLWRQILRDALLHSLGVDEFINLDKTSVVADTTSVISALHRLAEAQDASRFHVDPRGALEYVLSAVNEA